MTPVRKNRHVAFVGAGAVGGLVAGLMAEAGTRVTIIDAWPAHIAKIRDEGLALSGTHGERRIRLQALHICDVQALMRDPVDIAFVSVKLYDTQWATALIAPYLAQDGFIVTMQNGLIEEEVAQIVGWQRVVGCVVSRVQVELLEPGHVRRSNPPGGELHTAFRVGEAHGRVTPRATAIADLLSNVDSSKVTTNLWGERWSKLVANSMTSPVNAVSGLPFRQMYEHPDARRLVIRLAAEAIGLGQVLGFTLEPIFGTAPDDYLRAESGDATSRGRLETAMRAWQATSLGGGSSGIAQDLRKRRRTELDYLGGYVAARAAALRFAAPTQAAITQMVRRIERDELEPRVDNLGALLAAAGDTA
jgi:2-dehydropantoate 2-reductase